MQRADQCYFRAPVLIFAPAETLRRRRWATSSYRKKRSSLRSGEIRASPETFVDSLCRNSEQFTESSLEGVLRSRLPQIGASVPLGQHSITATCRAE